MDSAIAELEESQSLQRQAENATEASSEASTAENSEENENSQLPPPAEGSMQEYYQLQQTLLKLTLVFSGIIFLCVWGAYSLNTALNYVIGACTGIVYFRMLGKSVSSIGREKPKPSSGRLAIFIGVMIVSTQWQQLSVLPVFLGFLTYKAALIAFVIWTAVMPSGETA